MKTCPKCGTVLDDDKKKCYMCGADLIPSSVNQFSDSFDNQLGANMTNGQDNVYNNMNNMGSMPTFSNPNTINSMNNINMNNPNPTNNMTQNPIFTNNNQSPYNQSNFNDTINQSVEDNSNMVNSGADYFNNSNSNQSNSNGLNGLNSMQYDNRNVLEKMFSGNKIFKSKDDINADLQTRQNQGPSLVAPPSPQPITKNPPPVNPINQFMSSQPNQQFLSEEPTPPKKSKKSFFRKKPQPETETDLFTRLVGPQEETPVKAPKKTKNKINWSKELDEIHPTTKVRKNPFQKSGAYLNMVINIAIFLIFVISIFAVYFIFFKPKETDNFGGLSYTIDDKFTLKNEDKKARYYTYGDNCAIQIKYGTADDEIGFINNYFESVKEQYKAEDGYLTQSETMNINENNWSSISILQVVPNPAEAGGTQTIVKYKYVSMIYKGNYYQIVYANTDNNNECSAMYDNMIDSMEFEEPED